MTAPTPPALDCPTVRPIRLHAAPQPVDAAAVGEPTGVARKGVRTSPEPQAGDPDNPTPERPGLRIYAPPVYRDHYDGARWSKRYGDTPTAAYACRCGQTGNATGARAVAALLSKYDIHRDTCPLRRTEEGRAAA
ncbi:hypothetical protein GCM10010383_51560 [Streptomyces lomondensis]|uniref:Uncharacterized protein n=1 Tax=Streptomyces lomondensis TaxID=68229 RepID=A0ABQ2XHS1_9ACTN|nr:hypothetical protein GCM10010383_51560 [Streptomyces lomondensis]